MAKIVIMKIFLKFLKQILNMENIKILIENQFFYS